MVWVPLQELGKHTSIKCLAAFYTMSVQGSGDDSTRLIYHHHRYYHHQELLVPLWAETEEVAALKVEGNYTLFFLRCIIESLVLVGYFLKLTIRVYSTTFCYKEIVSIG